MGTEISAMLDVNFPSWLAIPRNLRSSVQFVGLTNLRIADVFCRSGDTPYLSMRCPKKVRVVRLNSHFSLLSVIPVF